MDEENKTLMVTIRCITYNHETYIRRCLEGFVMQKTSFRFEAIVHDDASTDGTVSIIKEYAEKYPEIIKPIYETENQYSKHDGSLRRIMDKYSLGKYIAFCEGDDYWIDPYKLQKQVDYMEDHPDCVLCHTSILYYYEYDKRFYKSNAIDVNKRIIQEGLTAEKFLTEYRIQTVSVVVKRNAYNQAIKYDPQLFDRSYLMGDMQLWYSLFLLGEIYFIPEVTCVYRKNKGSATTARQFIPYLKFNLSVSELMMYLGLRDHLSKDYIERAHIGYSRNAYCMKCLTGYVARYPILKKHLGILPILNKLCLLKTFLYMKNMIRVPIGYLRRRLKVTL